MKPNRTRKQFSGDVEHLEPRTMLTGAPELVRDINIQIEQSEIGHLMAVGDSSFFLKNHDLWMTDGTADGTRMIQDVSPVTDTSVNFPIPSISRHQIAGDRLYFVKTNPRYESLWSSNGTSVLHSDELWVTDGTKEGTVRLAEGHGEIRDLVQVGAKLFFTSSFESRTSLWQTDGSTNATQEVVPRTENVGAIAQFRGQIAFSTSEAVWTLNEDLSRSKLLDIPYVDSISSMSDGLYVTTSHELPGQQDVVVDRDYSPPSWCASVGFDWSHLGF